MLTLIQGPAGGAKSQVAAELLAAGDIDLLADVTALWVALSGVVRGPDGRYPIRSEDDAALVVALYAQAVVARRGLEAGARVAVTTSRRGQVSRWADVAAAAGADFTVRTVDPGEAVVRARLADPVTGVLSPECGQAVGSGSG